MQSRRMKLSDIPPEVQKMYNIDSEVEVNVDDTVNGGHFVFKNKEGKEVEMDAVELFGTDIKIGPVTKS